MSSDGRLFDRIKDAVIGEGGERSRDDERRRGREDHSGGRRYEDDRENGGRYRGDDMSSGHEEGLRSRTGDDHRCSYEDDAFAAQRRGGRGLRDEERRRYRDQERLQAGAATTKISTARKSPEGSWSPLGAIEVDKTRDRSITFACLCTEPDQRRVQHTRSLCRIDATAERQTG